MESEHVCVHLILGNKLFMAVYAIGDIQGCLNELKQLLDKLAFDPEEDQIWLAGDLVNRGPLSVDTLRFVKALPAQSVRVVLGNHDMHLLARAAGVSQYQHRMDTIEDVLQADDHDELIDWLRSQPLFYHDETLAFSMVHAGLPPQWTVSETIERAREVESVLQSDNWRDFLAVMYGNEPDKWSPELAGYDRLRFILNCLTRLRYCTADGRLALKFKGSPADTSTEQMPWFEVPGRRSEGEHIVFGHWSQLGTGQYGNVLSLDSGAVWGEKLTAVRIDKTPFEWTTVDADAEALPNAR